MKIPYLDFYKLCKKRLNLHRLITFLLIVLIIASIIVLAINTTYFNQQFIMLIGSVILIFLFWFLCFNLMCFHLQYFYRYKHIEKILASPKIEIVGEVINICNCSSTFGKIKAREVLIKDNKEEYLLYWDESLIDCNLKVNKKVKIISGNNFIREVNVYDEKN